MSFSCDIIKLRGVFFDARNRKGRHFHILRYVNAKMSRVFPASQVIFMAPNYY